MRNTMERRQFSLLAFVFQTVFVVLIAIFGRYNSSITMNPLRQFKNLTTPDPGGGVEVTTPTAAPNTHRNHNHHKSHENNDTSSHQDPNPNHQRGHPEMDHHRYFMDHDGTDYPLFQDVHVMVIVGFGFLMSFLKRYGFSAISVNLLLSAFVVQYVLLLRGFLSHEFIDHGVFRITINELIVADLSCCAVLITMGVLLGKLTPVQFLVLAFIEASFGVLLEHTLFTVLRINDAGRALAVHCFGAYFGLAALKVCRTRHEMSGGGGADDTAAAALSSASPDDSGVMGAESGFNSKNSSELFSMIGTLFLWIFFPSLNAATQDWANGARERSILNTYFAIAACTTVTFMISSLSDQFGRFNVLHVQSSTLAGGISVAAVANVLIYPHHAMLVGAAAGALSVVGHVLVTPKILEKRLALYDSCGIHNVHGLPGVFAGLLGAFFAVYYNPGELEGSGVAGRVYAHFPMSAGSAGDASASRLISATTEQWTQAGYQAAGLAVTLAIAVIGGLFSGWVMNFSALNQMPNLPSYEDTNYYLHAEFSLFGKLENGAIVEDFDSAMRGERNEHTAISASLSAPLQVKAIY